MLARLEGITCLLRVREERIESLPSEQHMQLSVGQILKMFLAANQHAVCVFMFLSFFFLSGPK